MSSNFEQIKIKEVPAESKETKITPLNLPKELKVSNFEFSPVKKQGLENYDKVKNRFGALAYTDHQESPRAKKDAKFQMNTVSRESLGVDHEEQRAIQELVDQRVKAIADEAREIARKEGFEVGLKEGKEEAHRLFQENHKDKTTRIEKVIEEFESAKKQIFNANQKFLMELVLRISKNILLKELQTDQDYLLRLTVELLDRVGLRENIRIKISPDSKDVIEFLRKGLIDQYGELKNLHIEVSENVKGGGCVVETDWNKIDASIETQLKKIEESLVDKKEPA